MNGTSSIWNKIPGLIEALGQCISKNWSARKTAESLSELAGQRVSKNMVIGKARRSDLPSFQSGEDGKYPRKPKPLRRQVPINVIRPKPEYEQPPERPITADFLGLTLMELSDNGCRFPAGEGPSYLFCGNPQWGESSYCEKHHLICNTGIPPYKRAGAGNELSGTQAGHMQNGTGRIRGFT
jgi:hypothetical protein